MNQMFVHPPLPKSYVDTLTPNVMVFLGINEVRVRPHDGIGGCIKRGRSLPPAPSPGTEERSHEDTRRLQSSSQKK